MSRLAFAWARRIPAPFDVRGALLEISMQAAEDGHVLLVRESKLAATFGGCGVSTLRLMLNYLIHVGALQRLGGQGSHHGLRLRVCVEAPPELVAERIEQTTDRFLHRRIVGDEDQPQKSPHRRIVGDEGQPSHRRIVGDEGASASQAHRRIVGDEGETLPPNASHRRIVGDDSRDARALSSLRTNGLGVGVIDTVLQVNESEHPKGARPAGARAREGQRGPKPAPFLSDDERQRLHERWDKSVAAGDVEDAITMALAHENARKYGAAGWFLYVNNWIRRDAQGRTSSSHGSSNGHIRGNSTYKGDAQQMSELRPGIRLGADAVVQ